MPEEPNEAPSPEGKTKDRLSGISKPGKRWRAFWSAFVVLMAAAFYSVWTRPASPPAPGRPASMDRMDTAPSFPESWSGRAPAAAPQSSPAGLPVPFTKSPHYASALSVAGMEEDGNRAEAIEALMETWVGANPQQAADWAGSLPAGTFRDDALSALMVHWAGHAPADAAGWMSRTGVDDGEAASVVAGSWAATNPSAATAWAASMGNLETRRLALSSAVSAWANTDPRSAAAFAERLPANDRSAAITTVVSTWATTAPSEAAAWLTQIPFESDSDQAIAMGALVTPWSTQNPAAVSKFINSLPEGPGREAAASQFAVSAAATAPAEALMWAMNLKEPDQRNQVTADACETWYDRSPETFRAGIAEAIALMDDPAMRRSVYEMLYERDPDFQTKLLQMVDQTPLNDPAAPAAPVSPSVESLLLPDAALLPQPAPNPPDPAAPGR